MEKYKEQISIKRATREKQHPDIVILESIRHSLIEQPDMDPSDIEIVVRAGEVELNGSVLYQQDKEFAEMLADNVDGVLNVMNNLEVQSNRFERTLGRVTLQERINKMRLY